MLFFLFFHHHHHIRLKWENEIRIRSYRKSNNWRNSWLISFFFFAYFVSAIMVIPNHIIKLFDGTVVSFVVPSLLDYTTMYVWPVAWYYGEQSFHWFKNQCKNLLRVFLPIPICAHKLNRFQHFYMEWHFLNVGAFWILLCSRRIPFSWCPNHKILLNMF